MKRNEFKKIELRGYVEYYRDEPEGYDLWEDLCSQGYISSKTTFSDLRWFNFVGFVIEDLEINKRGRVIGDSDERKDCVGGLGV